MFLFPPLSILFPTLRQSADGEFILCQILCLIREPRSFQLVLPLPLCCERKSLLCLWRKLNKQQKAEILKQSETAEHIRWRWVAPIPASPSTLRCSLSPLHPGDSSFHRQRGKMFTRAVDHCDTSCGPTQGDGRLWGSLVKCSAPEGSWSLYGSACGSCPNTTWRTSDRGGWEETLTGDAPIPVCLLFLWVVR